MTTSLRMPYLLKITFVTVGLTYSFALPEASQSVLDPVQRESFGTTVAATPALQPLKNVEFPRITPPAIPEHPITVQSNELPLSAMFPQFDGDGFFFSPRLTEATVGSAEQVFKNAVIPFLTAIGFQNATDRFRPFGVDYQGRELPRADLETLAKITCRQWWNQNKKAQYSCASLSEPSNLTSETTASFKTRTGMTARQFKDTLERIEVEYFFTQQRKVEPTEHPGILDIPQQVPLEHTGIRVEGRKGETGLFITGRVINDDMNVTNVISIRPDEVLTAATKALMKIKGVRSVNDSLLTPAVLLLLPYGGSGEKGVVDRPALRYAYRTALLADFLGMKGTFYVWVDAGTGEILQLVPAMGSVTAKGKTFLRNPNSLPSTGLAEFEIDDPPGTAPFTLMQFDVFKRLDRLGDFNDDDDEVAESSEKFDQASFSAHPTIQSVACASTNRKFAQVDLMATISRYRATFNAVGVLSTFPSTEQNIVLEDSQGCNAYYSTTSGFYFGRCSGYSSPSCPNTGELNPAHDHTVVAHEAGHAFTLHQMDNRPTDWCLGPTLEDGTVSNPCPMPNNGSFHMFHDFADAWIQVLEDTNCLGGWWGKNSGGTNVSLNCKHHHEDGWSPRLSKVGMAFNPNEDRFPEHRKPDQRLEYSDMQIAAAALWSVRQSLKSWEPVMGELLYYPRFVRTLATIGSLGQPQQLNSGYTDRDIYRNLVELEIKLASRWSGNPGESTVNKVVSGFAQAGIFMIPWWCLTIPAGNTCDSGADAVIDVGPGKDYLARSGPRPTFHIWTGPNYKFDGTDSAFNFKPSAATRSPCNTAFEVEIASDETFTVNRKTSTPTSGVWKTVSNKSSSGCHKTWKPSPSAWNVLKGTSGEAKVYFRVTTKKSGSNVRISTRPANGLFGEFDPPHLVVSGSL